MKFHFLRGFLATSAFFLLMASSSNSTYYCCCYGTSMKMLTTTTLLRERPFLFTQHPAFRSSSLCLFLSTDHNSNNQQQHDAATTTKTLAPGSHCTELLVKKSRFVAYAASVDSWPQAQDYLSEIKLQHPKARHWCWGYVGGGSQQQQQQQQRQHEERCSDDGEPTGTAGLPILGAIHGEGLEQVMCVVVRYFGGIKLGAGGLIRSYGAAARQTLREAPVQVLVPVKRLRVRVDSASHVGVLYETIGKVSGTTTASGEVYGDDGSLTMDIVCQAALEGQFRESLQDATRGSAVFLSNDDEYDSSAD